MGSNGKIGKLILALSGILVAGMAYAEGIMGGDGALPFEFRYPGWKSKALTFSYDDAVTEDRQLVKIFNRYGLKATFNISSGRQGPPRFISSEEYKTLYVGHEIASHGKHHCYIDFCNPKQVEEEYVEDRAALEKAFGQKVRGYAYPYGAYRHKDFANMAQAGIAYARTAKSNDRFDIPDNFLEWVPTMHGINPKLVDMGKKYLKLPADGPLSLFYVWGHSYEFEKQHNWAWFERFCKMMSGQSNIWYVTNIDFCDYIMALRQVAYSPASGELCNNSAAAVYLVCKGKKIKLEPGSAVIVEKGVTGK